MRVIIIKQNDNWGTGRYNTARSSRIHFTGQIDSQFFLGSKAKCYKQLQACSQKMSVGGGSAPNRDDPILLAYVIATSGLPDAHVLHALLCCRPTGTYYTCCWFWHFYNSKLIFYRKFSWQISCLQLRYCATMNAILLLVLQSRNSEKFARTTVFGGGGGSSPLKLPRWLQASTAVQLVVLQSN